MHGCWLASKLYFPVLIQTTSYVGAKLVGSQNSPMEASVTFGDWKLKTESEKVVFSKGP